MLQCTLSLIIHDNVCIMIVLLLGPQGAGKGTQGAILSERLGMPVLGAGDLLREEAATGSELVKTISALIDKGNLAPPEVVTELMAKRIQRSDAKNGIILDGYPRDETQLKMMLKRFTPDVAVILYIDDDTAVRRLGGRWICKNRHIFNAVSHPPKVAGICDIDGLAIYQREDDKEEYIRTRLSIYHKDTEPVIEAMEKVGVCVVKIDASPDIETVAVRLVETIGKTCGVHPINGK